MYQTVCKVLYVYYLFQVSECFRRYLLYIYIAEETGLEIVFAVSKL